MLQLWNREKQVLTKCFLAWRNAAALAKACAVTSLLHSVEPHGWG